MYSKGINEQLQMWYQHAIIKSQESLWASWVHLFSFLTGSRMETKTLLALFSEVFNVHSPCCGQQWLQTVKTEPAEKRMLFHLFIFFFFFSLAGMEFSFPEHTVSGDEQFT